MISHCLPTLSTVLSSRPRHVIYSVLSRSKRHLVTDLRTVPSPTFIRAVASVRGIDDVKNGGKLL